MTVADRPSVDYEQHGRTYAAHRRPDPRSAARIWAPPGDARTVVMVRSAQSMWALLDEGQEARIVDRPAADLASGAWDAEHGHLRELDAFDGSVRLVVSEP